MCKYFILYVLINYNYKQTLIQILLFYCLCNLVSIFLLQCYKICVRSERIPLGEERSAVFISHAALKLADQLDVELPILVTFNIFFYEFPELEIHQRILPLVQLELVIQTFKYLLLHLIQQNGRILRKSLRKRRRLERLVIPNLRRQQQTSHQQPTFIIKILPLIVETGQRQPTLIQKRIQIRRSHHRYLPLHLCTEHYVLDKVENAVHRRLEVVDVRRLRLVEDLKRLAQTELERLPPEE